VGKTIAGGKPPAGATTTANVGLRSNTGEPFFGRKFLAQHEKDIKRRERCLKKAKTREARLKCDEVQAAFPLLRRQPLQLGK